MNTKAVFYIIVAIVLITLGQFAKEVCIEFIKSSAEKESSSPAGMFMIPRGLMGPSMEQQSQQSTDGHDFTRL